MITLTVTVPPERIEAVADAALRAAGHGSIAYWVEPVPEDERPENYTTIEELSA